MSSGDAASQGLDEAAEELYGLAPGEFTAERDRRAKEARSAGERDLATLIRALRRPSAAAWAVNALVRRRPDAVAALLDLGVRMRAAQLLLAGAELRALTTEQQKLTASIRTLAERDAADAGTVLSPAVGEQVVQTLRAALADEQAAVAVQSGRLTTHLEHTGFGPVDLDGAVAVPRAAPGPPPSAAEPPGKTAPAEHSAAREREAQEREEQERADQERVDREQRHREREERRRAARAAVEEAQRDAVRAAKVLRHHASRSQEAAERETGVADLVRNLEHRLQEARTDLDRAATAHRAAKADQDAAARAAREAEAALQRARHRLETAHPPG